jgi:hyperosmotically inducible protein
MRKSVVSLVSVVALLGFLAGTAAAQERKDLQIFNDVSKQVQRYVYYTIFDDVNASVDQGVVTLSGKVTMPFKATEIAKRVARVDGVKQVINKLEVLPVSPWDDELRYEVSRAIYGNPSFWQYAAMVNPPIHIIVERGRVTLTGVVNSNVDRMLARSLATSFNALSVKSELKTDAEVRAALEKGL